MRYLFPAKGGVISLLVMNFPSNGDSNEEICATSRQIFN
jgi:hypothetical protein